MCWFIPVYRTCTAPSGATAAAGASALVLPVSCVAAPPPDACTTPSHKLPSVPAKMACTLPPARTAVGASVERKLPWVAMAPHAVPSKCAQ